MATRRLVSALPLAALTLLACHHDPSRGRPHVGPACPASGPLFDRGPVAASDLAYVAPIASLVPPDHTFPTPHMYFLAIDDDPSTTDHDDVTVVAPAAIYVTSIGVRAYDEYQGVANERDYDLDFSVCQDVTGYMIHVRSITHAALSAALADGIASGRCDLSVQGTTLPGQFVNQRACTFNVDPPILIASGETIGTTGDAAVGIRGLDLGIRDYRDAAGMDFARPDRWCSAAGDQPRERCYAVSALALMPDAVAQPYEDLMTDGFGLHRTDAPREGNGVHLDVDGTAQGYWFPSPEADPRSANGPEYTHLFLGPDSIVPSDHVISMGARFATAAVPLAAGTYAFTPAASGVVNRAFDDVVPGTIHCYESLAGSPRERMAGMNDALHGNVIVMQLSADAQRLDVDVQARARCGAEPYALTANALPFVR